MGSPVRAKIFDWVSRVSMLNPPDAAGTDPLEVAALGAPSPRPVAMPRGGGILRLVSDDCAGSQVDAREASVYHVAFCKFRSIRNQFQLVLHVPREVRKDRGLGALNCEEVARVGGGVVDVETSASPR